MSPASDGPDDGPFPVCHYGDVPPRPPEALWLVEQLWCALAVGIIGGIPK